MDHSKLPLVALHLLGYSDTERGWWASQMHMDGHTKLYGGVCTTRDLEAVLNIALRETLAKLRRPCHVLVHAPPNMHCPQTQAEHTLDHIPTMSQGLVFDQLRRVGSVISAVTPPQPGKEGLAHILATSDSARGIWTAIVIEKDGAFIQIMSGGAQTTPTRLALQALAQGVKMFSISGPVVFVTDSEYVLSGQEGMFRWPANNWRNALGQPLKNTDLWRAIHEATRGRPVVWARILPEQVEPLQALIAGLAQPEP